MGAKKLTDKTFTDFLMFSIWSLLRISADFHSILQNGSIVYRHMKYYVSADTIINK